MQRISKLKKRVISFILVMLLVLTSTVPAFAETGGTGRVNLALGKKVTAAPGMDVTEDMLAKVTDGVIAKDWTYCLYSHQGSEEENPDVKLWIQIDLGDTYTIDEIKYAGVIPVADGYDNISHNMVFRVSNDPDFKGDSTKTVFNTDANNFFGFGEGTDTEEPSKLEGRSITFEPTSARYVRYYQHGLSQLPAPGANYAPNGMTVCEIEVYGEGGEEPPVAESPNLALGKTVTVAPENMENVTEEQKKFVTDGIIDKDWTCCLYSHQGSETEDPNIKLWVQIDLGDSYDISKIVYSGVIPVADGYDNISHNMVFRVSNDPDFKGDSTKTVFNTDANNFFGFGKGTDTEEPSKLSGREITFEPTNARYVRYYQHGLSQLPSPGANYAPNGITVCEIGVYSQKIVTFVYNDGTDTVTKVGVDAGNRVVRPEEPISSTLGLRFDKWTVDVAGGVEWDFSQPITDDLTLVANWKEVGIHTIRFDSDGGTPVKDIQVTDGLGITRPEKDGYVFAGWRLNGDPYFFGTPVTEDILLTAVWVDPPAANAVTIHAGLMDVVLDSHGRVTNIISTLDGTDYSTAEPDGELRSLVSLVAGYNIETPTGVQYDEENGKLVFDFATINTQATLTLVDEGDYTSLTLTDLQKPEVVSVQAILWGPLKNTIKDGALSTGVAYDDSFAIGMHMLNTKTVGGWPNEFKDDFYPTNYSSTEVRQGNEVIYSNSGAFSTWGSAISGYTWDYTQDTMRTVALFSEVPQLIPAMTSEHITTGYHVEENASMIGSSVGLYGTRKDNILNVISNIQLTEGLPHPTIDGEWQKTSIKTGQDFLVFTDAIWGNLENDIQMGLDSGIKYLYGQYGVGGPWAGDGSYEFDSRFGGSDENAKQMVEQAAESGIYLGTHTLTNLINANTKYVSPEATSALSFIGHSALTRDISVDDTTIYVADGYPFSETVVGACGGNRNVRIGGEIITYTGCMQISDTEWQLTGCSRGAYSTPVSEHKADDAIYKLWNYYTAPFVGGWDSLEPMIERMSEVYGDVGIHAMSTDAFEATKMSAYSTLMPTEFKNGLYEKLVEKGTMDGFINESSNIDTNTWDAISRVSWGESNTPISTLMTSLNYYRKNFLPSMLGWIYDYGNHGGYGEANLLMNLSMKGGWEAGAGWYVNKDTFKSYPYMAEWIKTWNNAIQRGAFVVNGKYTTEIQDAMRQAWTNGRIWTLTETVADQEWVLQEVNKSNPAETIGDPITLYATNDIVIEQPQNGDVATDRSLDYSRAHAGDVVTVYEQAFTGYRMAEGSLTVIGKDGTNYDLTPVEGQTGTYTFTMPAQCVTITAVSEVDEDPVDKTALTDLYNTCKDVENDNYTEDTWNAFQDALNNAETVLNNEEATQDEVDAAEAALTKARNDLVQKEPEPVIVDKKALEEALKSADALNEEDYTAETWSTFVEAKAEAERVFADENATQDEVDAAVKALTNAQNSLEEASGEPDEPDKPPVISNIINRVIKAVESLVNKIAEIVNKWFEWIK